MLLLVVALATCPLTCTAVAAAGTGRDVVTFRFVLAPKSVDNIFFDESRDGCYDRATAMNAQLATLEGASVRVECLYIGPTEFEPTGYLQADMLQALLNHNTTQGDQDNSIDGMSISIRGADFMRPVIETAMNDYNVPITTFDADLDESSRLSYIGTDNVFFGEQLGAVLKRIQPQGGTFAIISDIPSNIVQRETGLRKSLIEYSKASWEEVAESPQYEQGNGTLAIEQMRYLAQTYPNITAIIPTMGAPMFLKEEWKVLVREFPHITFVVADGLQVQLQLLGQAYGHGLVAQLPYEMGVKSLDSLLALTLNNTHNAKAQQLSPDLIQQIQVLLQLPSLPLPAFQGTNVLQHLTIPLVLPELVVENNHLGRLSIVGFTMFAMIFVTSLGLAVWTWKHRTCAVLALAQPPLLLMIAFGCLVLGSTILPLSFDDATYLNHNHTQQGILICMSQPWLACLGFTIIFSALSVKYLRIIQLHRSSLQFKRVQVSIVRVAWPFGLLFAANVAVLTVWTILDPLTYVRFEADGVDPWGRVIATYGTCQSLSEDGDATPYIAVLATLNLLVLLFKCWQAYRARNINRKFSESHYIAVAMASMLQAVLIGVPLLFLVKDIPQAFYLTVVFVIFIVTMVIMLLLFVPKIASTHRFLQRSRESQRHLILESIANMSERSGDSRGGNAYHSNSNDNMRQRKNGPKQLSQGHHRKTSSIVSLGMIGPFATTTATAIMEKPDTAVEMEKAASVQQYLDAPALSHGDEELDSRSSHWRASLELARDLESQCNLQGHRGSTAKSKQEDDHDGDAHVDAKDVKMSVDDNQDKFNMQPQTMQLPSSDEEVDVDHHCRRATLDDSYETTLPCIQAAAKFNDSVTTRTPTESPEYTTHMVPLSGRNNNPPFFPSSSYIRRTAENVSEKEAVSNADLGPAISIVNASANAAGTGIPSGLSKTAEEIGLQPMDHTRTDAATPRY